MLATQEKTGSCLTRIFLGSKDLMQAANMGEKSARKSRFGPISMELILQECCDIVGDCIMTVKDMIPKGFPDHIAGAIFTGLMRTRERLVKG